MAAMQQEQDWQAEAVDLKRNGLESKEIGEVLGKHPATVRKVIAAARERGELPEPFTAVEDEPDEPIPGQVDIDGNVAGEDVPPEDDPEYEESDPLDAFKREAGEAVGPMPPEEPEDTEPEQESRLKGTRQLALDFGPNADPVLDGTIVFKSERRKCGHYGGGDIITGTFTARVTEVPYKESFDKASEEYRAKPTAYVATITELELD